jgi:hypothetical protein
MVTKQMESIKHASKTTSSSLSSFDHDGNHAHVESKNRGRTAEINHHDLPAGSVQFLWLLFPLFRLCSPWPAECVGRQLLLGTLSIGQTILDLGLSVSRSEQISTRSMVRSSPEIGQLANCIQMTADKG